MAAVLTTGDRFPDIVLHLDGKATRVYSRIGGKPVLVLIGEVDLSDSDLGSLEGRCEIVRVGGHPARGLTFQDPEGVLADLLGDASATYLLDPNLRVVVDSGEVLPIDEYRAALDEMEGRVSRVIDRQAPVLLVDRVLEPDRCSFLMQLWTQASVETGVEKSNVEGRGEVLSAGEKSRRDHAVSDPKLIRLLTQSIGSRLIPEIERAFVYKPTHFEGFKIVCYDADKEGFFGAHRDNLSPSTSHRRLAVSLNLNDAFVGGALRFSEFSDDQYCPVAGSALVFSCVHLHEVLPVTDGRRFTLLTFLYHEASKRDVVDPFAI